MHIALFSHYCFTHFFSQSEMKPQSQTTYMFVGVFTYKGVVKCMVDRKQILLFLQRVFELVKSCKQLYLK